MATLTAEQQYLETIVTGIVTHPEAVQTDHVEDELGTLVSLHVHPDDMRVIIGKEGRTAKALRTLLRAMGATHDKRVNLRIIEPEGGLRYGMEGMAPQATPPLAAPDHVAKALRDLPVDDIL
jgi:hypothetical protein